MSAIPQNTDDLHSSLARVLIREPAEVYHARRGECLTSHRLAEFRSCPLLFRRKEMGLVPDRDSHAFLVGRAAHTLIRRACVEIEFRKERSDRRIVGWPSTHPRRSFVASPSRF